MADLCVIYSSHNKQIVAKLVDVLEQHWSVWWDDKLVGPFQKVIPEELKKTKCIIPVWSVASQISEYFYAELEIARKADAKILPVKIEECEAPYAYAELSTADLSDWVDGSEHLGLSQLLQKISTIVKPTRPVNRPHRISGSNNKMPAIFLSVSSYETRLRPLDAIRILSAFLKGESIEKGIGLSLLVSAYDLAEKNCRNTDEKTELNKLRKQLKEFKKSGGFVMVDSGNYEAVRENDKTWSSKDLENSVSDIPYDWLLSFDYSQPVKGLKKRSPITKPIQLTNRIIRDSNFSKKPIIPIVHSPENKGYGHDLANIPKIFKQLAEKFCPKMIAIPERELGPTLFDCAKTISQIRNELDTLTFYQPIHILGTGNPRSILLYTACGADSFDGLEWCRYVFDDKDKHLHHTQHFSLYEYQAHHAESIITKNAMADNDIRIGAKVALHNLECYARFSTELIERTKNGELEVMAARLFDESALKELKSLVPGIFK